MKIVYCTNSIGTRGGIERVTIVKANALAEIESNEVYIVFTDEKNYPETIYPLSPKVNVVNLNVRHWDDQYTSFFERFFIPKWKMIKHFVRLQKFVSEVCPDILISIGQSEKYILPLLYGTRVLVREVHFNSTYRYDTYGNSWIRRLKAKVFSLLDFRLLCKMYDMTFLLTKQDKEENFSKIAYIQYMHNPSTFFVDGLCNSISKRENVILSVGRLNYQKNYLALIRIWASICAKYPNWLLRIVGEGPQRKELENLIRCLNLEDRVELIGFSNKVDYYMRSAKIFAMTSLFEGLALVSIEAMACRLPLVSYETKYGPRDLIVNNINGFLVPMNDETLFAQKLSALIENKDLRMKMSLEAEKRASDFEVDKIINQWMKVFNHLLGKYYK